MRLRASNCSGIIYKMVVRSGFKLAVAAVLLSCLLIRTQGIIVGTATADPNEDVLKRICQNKTTPDNTTYCWPRSQSKYVTCSNGTGTLQSCPTGTIYDYVVRTCVNEVTAMPCPNEMCVESLPGVQEVNLTQPPLSLYGQFGQIGNVTLNFTKAGEYRINCPVYGHCLGGMTFSVNVTNDTNPDPQVVDIGKYNEYEEVIYNSSYPQRLKDITLKLGDSLFIDWDEPVHQVLVYDMTTGEELPVAPYPPQPTYACPNFTLGPNDTIPVVPGESRLVSLEDAFNGTTNYTWTAEKPGDVWFVCSLPYHCRLGQVFKATVKDAAPPIATSQTYPIYWMLTDYENFPDKTLNVGDKLYFYWGLPQPVHMLSMFDYLPTLVK